MGMSVALRVLVIVCAWTIVGSAIATEIVVQGLFRDMAILLVDGKQRKVRAGETTPEGVKLKTVRVGNIELHDVDAAVLDGDSPTEVLLGMSFLNRVDMKRQGEMLELRRKW